MLLVVLRLMQAGSQVTPHAGTGWSDQYLPSTDYTHMLSSRFLSLQSVSSVVFSLIAEKGKVALEMDLKVYVYIALLPLLYQVPQTASP